LPKPQEEPANRSGPTPQPLHHALLFLLLQPKNPNFRAFPLGRFSSVYHPLRKVNWVSVKGLGERRMGIERVSVWGR